MNKRLNPYSRLLNEITKWCEKVRFRHEVIMWRYPKDKLDTGWNLGDLYERTTAARQLGYEVHLSAEENGLLVKYVKKLPSVPYEWR